MITIAALKEYGANIDEGLSRCMGNEALYLRLTATIPNDVNFNKLCENIEAGDLGNAFENAHALKGVTGNLSLTPLYNPLVQITELLRAREDTDYTELMNEILKQKDRLSEICC